MRYRKAAGKGDTGLHWLWNDSADRDAGRVGRVSAGGGRRAAAGGRILVRGSRFALALMFALTGVAHFIPRGRAEMVRMVPPRLPRPDLLVTLTGMLELLGAAGL